MTVSYQPCFLPLFLILGFPLLGCNDSMDTNQDIADGGRTDNVDGSPICDQGAEFLEELVGTYSIERPDCLDGDESSSPLPPDMRVFIIKPCGEASTAGEPLYGQISIGAIIPTEFGYFYDGKHAGTGVSIDGLSFHVSPLNKRLGGAPVLRLQSNDGSAGASWTEAWAVQGGCQPAR